MRVKGFALGILELCSEFVSMYYVIALRFEHECRWVDQDFARNVIIVFHRLLLARHSLYWHSTLREESCTEHCDNTLIVYTAKVSYERHSLLVKTGCVEHLISSNCVVSPILVFIVHWSGTVETA